MRPMVPLVEAADYVYFAGIRCPEAEASASLAIDLQEMSSHFFVNAIVAALIEQITVVGGEQANVVSGRSGIGELAHDVLVCRDLVYQSHAI